jgi:hypothetical protein
MITSDAAHMLALVGVILIGKASTTNGPMAGPRVEAARPTSPTTRWRAWLALATCST